MRASELLRRLQEMIDTYHGDPDILVEDGIDFGIRGDAPRVIKKPVIDIDFKRDTSYGNDFILMRKTRY